MQPFSTPVTAHTNGIVVSVMPRYERTMSHERGRQFMYTYHIIIENVSAQAVQLLSRHWHILDSMVGLREVVGDGVVGEQPVIMPGHTYEYSSGCQLSGDHGAMWGTYTMQYFPDGATFEVEIPRFLMELPAIAN